jgi:hypothetical protein
MEGTKKSVPETQKISGTNQMFSGVGKYFRAVNNFPGEHQKISGDTKMFAGST